MSLRYSPAARRLHGKVHWVRLGIIGGGILSLILVVVLGWWVWQSLDKNEVKAMSPAFSPLEVEEAWQQIILQYSGIGVGAEVWDVATGTRASINALEPFRAASTTKMLTASYLMHLVDQGDWQLDKRLADGVTTQWHLEQMVRYSNNDSWRKFHDALGRDKEEAYAHQIGATSFDLQSNYITTNDLARIMRMLANDKLLRPASLDVLLSFMTDTYEERLIPPSAPAGAVVYHKAGTLEGDIHDAAIIEYQGRRYVMVIMSNGPVNYDTRIAMFAELVQAFFSKLAKT